MTRRDFLRATALFSMTASARRGKPDKGPREPVRCALIGTGRHGRKLLGFLIKVPGAKIVALCDTYEPHLKRAQGVVGQPVKLEKDFRRLLEDPQVDAVIVATPPDTHKDIVLAALEAGKHVWCEPPLALDVKAARAIAKAGAEAETVFQVGLQRRYNPTYRHAVKFMRTGAIGKPTLAHGQWHEKTSWRVPVKDKRWERRLNWKLYQETSGGLITEVALHQFDVARWFLYDLPVSVSAWGSLILWRDGREVPDTIQCVLEFPEGIRLTYHATLTNSFMGTHDIFTGEYGAIYLSGLKGILFKEADAPSLGWEVYARRERLGRDEGYLLVADATKLIEKGKMPGEVGMPETLENDEFFVALRDFVTCIREGRRPRVSALQGWEATLIALKTLEALKRGTSVPIPKELFRL